MDKDAPEDGTPVTGSRVMMADAKAGALFVQGSWPEAFRLQQETLAEMRADQGRCRWLAGDYAEATGTMAEVHRGYASLPDGHMLDENHPWRLSYETDYAIIRRDNDPTAADLRVLADDAHELRRRCWRARGADHPHTLAATVVLASVLRRIDGRKGQAVRLLEEAERR